MSYRYDRNSTGTFGLTGQPNFTTIGKGEGFAINWSALLPNWPTLSVGYSQGSGGGTIYGTSEETHSTNRLFNLRSGYQIAGFRLNAFFNHNSNNSTFPQFLTGDSASIQDSTSHDIGFGAQHSLPLRGTFYASFDRASSDSNYFSSAGQSSNMSSYTDNLENAGASFHPTQKFSFNLNENYTGNLSGYLTQSLDHQRRARAADQSGIGVPLHHHGRGRKLRDHQFPHHFGDRDPLRPVLLWTRLHRYVRERHRELRQADT